MSYDVTDPRQIRPDIKAALDGWADGSRPFVGDFLRAVLSNDLMGAVGRADHDNIRVLPAICSYVYMELPGPCHGSPEIVSEWQATCLAAREEKRAEVKA